MIWIKRYRRSFLAGDAGAGIIVGLILIPQCMAYALIAGLPAVTGLYACMLPAFAYAIFGSSMVASIGPMAISSLMVGTAVSALAPVGSHTYSLMAQQLAFVTGTILFVCGIARMGFLSNFFSRPVMSGFTSGAALVIALNQSRPLLGITGDLAFTAIHWPSATMGLISLLFLAFSRCGMPSLTLFCSLRIADILPKLAPIAVIVGATAAISWLGQEYTGIQTVGQVPAGLPAIALPSSFEYVRILLLPSLTIGFMVFLLNQSAAQTLALRRSERLNPNRELLGLGAANLASSVSGGFVVTGSISRSAVNSSSGANTPVASLIAAALIALALCLPNRWLSMLPLPAMAAAIIVAVVGMIDFSTLYESWHHDRSDAATLVATALGVLLIGVEEGVVLGVFLSFMSLGWRSSRARVAVIGRMPGSENFRSISRYTVETLPNVLMLRVDTALVFNNVNGVIDSIEQKLRADPAIRHLVLELSAVNMIDTTAMLAIAELNSALRGQERCMHFCEIKGHVMDRLERSTFISRDLTGEVFLSAAQAYRHLRKRDYL
jgi:SulP family sulfate permease